MTNTKTFREMLYVNILIKKFSNIRTYAYVRNLNRVTA